MWTANEEMRKQTIERYSEAWFYITNERDPTPSPANNLYLCARSRPSRAEAKVNLLPLRSDDTDFFVEIGISQPVTG